jgi:hypothetical protein
MHLFASQELLREADAADDLLEAGVGAERVEAEAEQDAGVEAFVEGFLEPEHGLIGVAPKRRRGERTRAGRRAFAVAERCRRAGGWLGRILDVVASAFGDVNGVGAYVSDIGVRGGCAVLFLGAAGDRLVATHFGLSFCLFVALVFFLAFQECGCQCLLESALADAGKIESLFPYIMTEVEPQSRMKELSFGSSLFGIGSAEIREFIFDPGAIGNGAVF